jgi:lipid-A-disaccharide synthase
LVLLVCAIETSANVHLKELKKYLNNDIEFIGIFDKHLGTPKYDIQELAVMGFVDIVKKLFFFLKLKNEMVELASQADKVLLMDASGFNLPLAKAIKKKYPKKKIIYYILPQAWAWKRKRIQVLEKTIDKLASILPFEKDYYSKGTNIKYVGHPLLDIIKKFKIKINYTVKSIAFMPGSRKNEIKTLMPIFRKLVKLINVKTIIIIPENFSQDKIDEYYGDIIDFEISNNTHKTLYEVDFAFICSGTATLEATLIGTPFILSYIAKPLDYFIATKLVKLEYIGLSNIMFKKLKNRPIHPELIQDNVTVENLLKAFSKYDKSTFLEDSKALRYYLQYGSAKNVASMISSLTSS